MKKYSFLIITAFILSACSSSSTFEYSSYEPEPKADYSKYKTFAYFDFTGKRELSPNMLSGLLAVEATITNQLEIRGFQLAKDGVSPDLYINIGTLLQQKTEYTEEAVAMYPEQYPYYWGSVVYATHYAPVVYQTNISARKYEEGTLLIDLVDGQKKDLIWHGAVSHVFNPGGEGVKLSNLSKQVILLFKNEFPIPVKQ